MALAQALALRVGADGGAALVIDYGRDGPYEDSLVALRGHKAVELLEAPGTADLSAWVDFGALRQAAAESGAPVAVHGPVSQADLLAGLGAPTRLQQLLGRATARQAAALVAGFERISGTGEGGMGGTYKALCIAHRELPPPPGFDPPASE
jgi:NADH dehydrogenase [ubiquinone] 1 alpha subcomplex assembly factor 7